MNNDKPIATIPRDLPPSVPSYTFDQMHRMAVTFAKSGLYGIKDENQAFALMLEAQATGRHPALIVRDFDMIGNRLAKKSSAMLRDFQASGGRVEWLELSDTKASAKFTHPLAGNPVTIDWDLDRAKRAGLANKEGGMYSRYARSMLRSRCISEGIRTIAPEATEQLYTVEEVQAMEAETPEPVSVETAIAEAAAEVQHEMPTDEFEALISSLDVTTRPELATAFNAGWAALKERGNTDQRRKFREWRNEMLSAIEGAV